MLEIVVVLAVLIGVVAAGAAMRSYRRFAALRARLIAYLKTAAPDITVEGPTDVGFAARVLGAEVAVDVATLARRRPPGSDDAAWFEAVADEIRARVPEPAVPPLALVEDRILPLLKPADYAVLFERYPPALRLAWRPMPPGLAITYFIEGLDRRTAVTASALQAWALTPNALHALAVGNLRAKTTRMLQEIGARRARYEHLDGLDATRILAADLIVPPEIADPIIAIPEESVLLIAPASDRAALAEEAAARYQVSTRPLCPQVLRLTAEGPVLAGPP